MTYYYSKITDRPFEETVARTRDVLKAEGFGIITEINVTQTFREKLDLDFRPYVILGACNPQLAHQALEIERQIGLLLPCNVVVRAGDGCTIVEALDAKVIAEIPDRDELVPVAEETGRLIRAALDSLTQQP